MPVERGIAMALGMEPVAAPRLDPTGSVHAAEEPYADVGARWPPTRSTATTPSTSTSRDPMCRRTTAAPRTSATSSPPSTRASSREVLRPDRPAPHDRGRHGRPLHLVRAQGAHGRPRPVGRGRRRRRSPTAPRAFGERACADGSLGQLLGPRDPAAPPVLIPSPLRSNPARDRAPYEPVCKRLWHQGSWPTLRPSIDQ